MTQTLPRSTPEAQGIRSDAIGAFLDAAERQAIELHSIMVVRHGHVVADGWWAPYGPEHPHLLYSLSKSFTSTAVGFAVAEGRLTVDDKVISFFAERLPAEVSENLAAMRVRDLLTMTSGHAEDTTPAFRASADGDWARAFLSLPVDFQPGTHFVYNSGATYMLSAILQHLTGETLIDYLRPRLFNPLGIERATSQSCPRGINIGGWGMSVTTESIARFGQFYLQQGVWDGQQLLSKEWIAEATAAQVPNGDNPQSDWNQGYGYQFWRCRHDAYRGDGAFGQFCIVIPEHDAVVALTAAVSEMQPVLDLVWEHLLPAFSGAALPANLLAHHALVDQLAQLALPLPKGEATSPLAHALSGATFIFAENQLHVESVACEFGDLTKLTFRDGRGDHSILAGHDTWYFADTTFDWNGPHKIASAGVWLDSQTYRCVVMQYETPHRYELQFTFDGQRLLFDFGLNVAMGPNIFPQLVGERSV